MTKTDIELSIAPRCPPTTEKETQSETEQSARWNGDEGKTEHEEKERNCRHDQDRTGSKIKQNVPVCHALPHVRNHILRTKAYLEFNTRSSSDIRR